MKMAWARRIFRLFAIAIFTVIFLISLEVHAIFEKDLFRIRKQYQRFYCRTILRILNVKLDVSGPLPKSDDVGIFIANHRSVLDIMVLAATFEAAFLSRADVATWPLFGRIAKHAGTVFVDRTDRKSGASAMRSIVEAAQGGAKIVIYPEGTTYTGDEVRPFRAGAFAASDRAEVPLVTVGIAYSPRIEWADTGFGAHAKALLGARSIRCGLTFSAPYQSTGSVDESLAEHYEKMATLIAESRRRVG